MNFRVAILFLVSGLLGLLLAVVGTHHLVTGSAWGGPRLIKKVSFSFSEFWINSDALAVMPIFAVRMQYPLTLSALERDYYKQARHRRYTQKDYERIRIGMSTDDVVDVLGSLGEYPLDGKKISRDGIQLDRYEYRNFMGGGFSVSYSFGKVVEKSAFVDYMGRQ